MKSTIQFPLALLFIFASFCASAQPEKARDSLFKRLPQSKDSARTAIQYALADLFYLEGMNDSAYYYANASREQAMQNGNLRSACRAILLAAKCKMHLQKFDEAITILFECIRIAEKESFRQEGANARTLVSIIYDLQGKPEESLKVAMIAEKDFLALKDTMGLISLYPEIVTCFGKNGDTVSALRYYFNGMELFARFENSSTISAADQEHMPLKKMALLFNGINVMTTRPDFEKALAEINKIDKVVAPTTNEYAKFEVAVLYSMVYYQMKEFREARAYAKKSLPFIRPESGNYDQLADAYHIIADAAGSLGDYKEAYESMVLYKQYNDSVYKIQSVEAIHSVEAKYEGEKKEARIVALNKEKRSQFMLLMLAAVVLLVLIVLLFIFIRTRRLKEQLIIREKEAEKAGMQQRMFELEQTALRAQMNPHFIFNCLNSVQRYILRNDSKGVNHYLTTFASLIRQTLENSGKEFISLKQELEYLTTYIQMEQMRGDEQFAFEIKVDPEIDTSAIYIPSMLIQPYVENAIQHGLKRTGTGTPRLQITVAHQQQLVITVEDNGPGIRGGKILGTDQVAEHHSMGTTITAKRVEMFNNTHVEPIRVRIEDKADFNKQESGTMVTFAFPIETSY